MYGYLSLTTMLIIVKNVIKKNKKESVIFADNRVYNKSTKLGALGYNIGRIFPKYKLQA